MPFAAFRDRRIRTMDVILLNALSAAPQDINGWTSVGSQTLAETLRVSKPWVIDAMKRLQAAGWVEARRRRDPQTGADLPSERRINWSNCLPGEEKYFNPGVNDVDTPLDVNAEGTLIPADFPDAERLAAAAADPRYSRLPLARVAEDFRRKHDDGATRRKSWPAAWDRWLRTAHKDYPDDRSDRGPDRRGALRGAQDARRDAGYARLTEVLAEQAVRGTHRTG